MVLAAVRCRATEQTHQVLTNKTSIFTLKSQKFCYPFSAEATPPTTKIHGTEGHRTHRKRSRGQIRVSYSGEWPQSRRYPTGGDLRPLFSRAS